MYPKFDGTNAFPLFLISNLKYDAGQIKGMRLVWGIGYFSRCCENTLDKSL